MMMQLRKKKPHLTQRKLKLKPFPVHLVHQHPDPKAGKTGPVRIKEIGIAIAIKSQLKLLSLVKKGVGEGPNGGKLFEVSPSAPLSFFLSFEFHTCREYLIFYSASELTV